MMSGYDLPGSDCTRAASAGIDTYNVDGEYDKYKHASQYITSNSSGSPPLANSHFPYFYQSLYTGNGGNFNGQLNGAVSGKQQGHNNNFSVSHLLDLEEARGALTGMYGNTPKTDPDAVNQDSAHQSPKHSNCITNLTNNNVTKHLTNMTSGYNPSGFSRQSGSPVDDRTSPSGSCGINGYGSPASNTMLDSAKLSPASDEQSQCDDKDSKKKGGQFRIDSGIRCYISILSVANYLFINVITRIISLTLTCNDNDCA